jgi:hypothetical protein
MRHFLMILGLAACSSQIPTLKEWSDSAIGSKIGELRALAAAPGSYAARTGWQERTYHLGNGNWVYVHPDRPNCEIHFEVDRDDVIVGYTPIGSGCRHQ